MTINAHSPSTGATMSTPDDDTIARALDEHYTLGIKPDWWKLEPQASARAGENISGVIAKHDPWCRGIVLLGLEAPEAELARAFEVTEGHRLVKGFAVGRTIFNHAAQQWLSGKLTDTEATADMADRFGNLVSLWDKTHRVNA